MSDKVNVLLINPKISNTSQNRVINRTVNISFPTSLGVIASYLMLFVSDEVKVIDEQINPINDMDLAGLISSLQRPRIIGISVLTLNSGRAYELAEKIKKIDPAATLVLGGIHPTVVAEEALSKEGVDVVVRGEGEETFKEMVRLILDKQDYRNIPGISYRQNGGFIHNPDRPFIENLDVIPPFPYYMFEKYMDRYPNFSGIVTSRGCPYRCGFCSSRSISGLRYRYHSVDRVIHEIKTLVRKYKQDSVFLMDDNIAVNKEHFKELCLAIKREGLHKEAFFHGSMRGDNASDEILDVAYEANFKIIYFGLETGSEKLMKIINKDETVGEVVNAIKRADKRGFSVGATIIFGLPTETRKDRYDTIGLVRSLPLQSVRFNTLAPYPGTPFYNSEYPKGKILVKNNWENFGVQYMWESDDIPYVPDADNRLKLIFDTMFANLSYYLSLGGIKRLFTQRYAAGNVVKLSDRWYLSFNQLKKMFSLLLYLVSRFLNVTIRMLWQDCIKMISGHRGDYDRQ